MSGTGVHYVGGLGEPTTIPAILRARAELSPAARFLTLGEETRTYGEALAAAERTADALAAVGIGRDSKVAALLPNSTEMLDVWFGTALLGAVFVPVNVGLRGDGLGYVVEHSEAELIVLDDSLVETLDAAVPVGRGPRHRYVRGDGPLPQGYGSLAELLGGAHPPAPRPAIAPGDLATILYTSGTTGPPKGVMNCHNAITRPAQEWTRNLVRVRADDVLYTCLPLFHANAQTSTTLGSLVSGRPAVISPRFSASRFFDELRLHGATVFNCIGAMVTILFKQPAREDDLDNPARLAVTSATPPELWSRFEDRFGIDLVEMYGLTETSTFCTFSPPDDVRVGKIGKPTRWAEVRIGREGGESAPDGEPGEILIRSKEPITLFLGYYKNEEATERAMEGGWFHSGDRGVRDPDGNFEFIDRLKDCIRRRGENISSFEVERIVNDHAAVAESAAVGVPSELGEDDILIVVVPRDGDFEPAELIEHCRGRMADFMVPRFVRVVDRLPKTATQRTEKYQLRDQGTVDAWDREAAEKAAK
ncbi:MAG: AMP-binding protein [Actinobacteria bacterium]|nr:AMP-binding protein [Actinomycetota bacterium]